METTFALLLAVSASGSVGSKECRLSGHENDARGLLFGFWPVRVG